MKFYRPREMDPKTHPAVLMDKSGESAIYEFVSGECSIDDIDVGKIEKMKGLGFYFRDDESGELVTLGSLAEARARMQLFASDDDTASDLDEPEDLADSAKMPIVRKAKPRRKA